MPCHAAVAAPPPRHVPRVHLFSHRWLGKHANIIKLKDLMVNVEDDELYLVMELMDSDLHRIIQSHQVLEDAHFKHFMCG